MHSMSAVCTVIENPFDSAGAHAREVAAGTRIADLDPKGKFPAICRLDGQWILRADWERMVMPGQVVEFYQYPQGGGQGGSDVGRTILMIAAVYVAVQSGGTWGGLFTAGSQTGTALAVLAATTLVNALVPVKAAELAGVGGSGGASASTAYTANLSANQARLDQAIPVLYGRNKTFPDFAAEPYAEFDNANDDQYFYALLCLGQGEYVREAMLIDDTNINDFSDVLVSRMLPPGTLPTTVVANIVNAPEVTGNELVDGRYIGPFIGCRAKNKAVKISMDFTFSRGLASYDVNGVPGNKTVSFRVEYRAVDDFGVPSLTDTPRLWTTLDTISVTAAQTSAVRRTYTYTLSSPCRPQVRVTRVTAFDDNNRVANTVEWAGLRCHLDAPATLCPTATYIEVKMRASEQLSGLSQRKIAVISRRKVRLWSPGGGWTAVQETRNPAWALADKWTNAVYGDGYADARCDLATLYTLAQVWDARQDRFDGVFDQTGDSFQADQMIAQAGRAAVIRRNTVMTVSRDQLRDLPVTAFTARNIAPGSVSIDYRLANESTPDGVIVEYWDNRLWDWVDILCPAPTVTTPVRPQRLKLFGVTGATHAEREGKYHAANSYYRRRYASFATELEGMIPGFGSAVVFAPSLPTWGKGGDLVSIQTSAPFLAQLSEPVVWTTAAKHYVSLVNRDGSLSTPYEVLRGADDYHVYFPAYPSVSAPSTDDAGSERTKYVFGAGTPYPVIARVLGLSSSSDEGGVRTFRINGVIENDLVHTADNALLPTGATVQDPVDYDYNYVPPLGSSVALVPSLPGGDLVLGGVYASIKLRTDGKAENRLSSFVSPGLVTGWWLLGAGPYDSSQTALFEVRLTRTVGDPLGAAIDTWLSLGTEREWYVDAPVGALSTVTFVLEIRTAATQRVEARLEGIVLTMDNRLPGAT